MSDPKKYFVWEVYFGQKKYIFDPERSTNCAKSSFSNKIIYELPHFWPLIFVKYFINFTYNTRDYKVAGIIWHWFLTNSSQQNFNRQYFTFLVFFVCKILFFGPKIVKNDQISYFCSQRSIFKTNLRPKKERSIRKYGKSPKEVSFFERSSTGHPG